MFVCMLVCVFVFVCVLAHTCVYVCVRERAVITGRIPLDPYLYIASHVVVMFKKGDIIHHYNHSYFGLYF